MTPLRIGMILDGVTERYGQRSAIANLLAALDPARIEVTGLFLAHGPAEEALAPLCSDSVCLEAGSLPTMRRARGDRRGAAGLIRLARQSATAVRRIAPIVAERELSVLHSHYWHTFLIGGAAARWCGVRSVWHLHGGFEFTGPACWAWDELGERLVDRVFCISRWVRSTLPPLWRQRSAVLYNGLDVAALQAGARGGAFRRRFNIPRDRPLIGAFGAVIDRKGFEFFLEAAAQLIGEGRDAVFALVGAAAGDPASEALYAALQKTARLAGLGERFIFAGQVPEAWREMADFDVLVLPTVPLWGDPTPDFGEGFGLVIAEGMAAGAATVATRCGAAPELIEDERTGLLVPPRDAAALAAALRRLLEKPDFRRDLAEAGRRSVAERFDANWIARSAEDLYDDLCDPA